MSKSRVRLNVGGSVFETTQETLSRVKGTMLEAMVAGRWRDVGDAGLRADHELFIDRDPTHFRVVLNYLRDGEVPGGLSERELHEVSREGQFYGIEELARLALADDEGDTEEAEFVAGDRVRWRLDAIDVYVEFAACLKLFCFGWRTCMACNTTTQSNGTSHAEVNAANVKEMALLMRSMEGAVISKDGERCYLVDFGLSQHMHVFKGALERATSAPS